MLSKSFYAFILFLGVCAVPVGAQTVTLDFQDLESPGLGYTFVNSYSSQGFTLTPVPPAGNPGIPVLFASPRTGNTDNYAGSTALAIYNDSASALSVRDNGAAFDAVSIDLSNFSQQFSSDQIVEFTGTRADGSTVVQDFEFSQFGFQTFTFTGFTNLVQLDFGVQLFPFYQFDNIVLNTPAAVPEPGSMALFVGTASTGGAFALRRRVRRSTQRA